MRFQKFSEEADRINRMDGNKEATRAVSNLISEADSDSTLILPRFIQGKVFPDFDQRNLSFSTSLMKEAISESTGIEEEELKQKLSQIEDMGSLFDTYSIQRESGQSTLLQSDLEIPEVYDTLESVAGESGSGSQQRRIDHIVGLFSRCSSIEGKYLTRLILGNMSIGVGSGTVRDAISRAFDVEKEHVERAIMLTNDPGRVATIARQSGSSGLKDLSLDVGKVPIKSMQATKSKVSKAFEDMDVDELIGDYKYDGFRLQIHKNGDNVELFTRRLERVTDSLPDIVESVKNNVDADVIVLDAEAVGYESDDYENPVDYQVAQRRVRRKHNIQEMVDEIPLVPKVFDALYYDDSLLLDEPLSDRLQHIDDHVSPDILAERKKCSNTKELQEIMSMAQREDHEGAMAKNPESTYEPNSRGKRWLKLKPEGETVDAVVVGGEYGDGRRSDFIASYRLALRDEDGNLKTIGDVGTGFSDEQFEDLTNLLEDEVVSKDGSFVQINPSVMFEVEFEEVQDSPKYTSGYSLRFPRYIRRRVNKPINEADTISRLKNIAETL